MRDNATIKRYHAGIMLKTFFRPTIPVVLSAFLITAVAAALMYYSLLCALNSGGNCVQIPVSIQLVVVVMLWPWIAAVRTIGVEYIAFGSVAGFVLSAVWMYAVMCLVRWAGGKFRRKKTPEAQKPV